MRHVTWYGLLAVGVLATPNSGSAQAPQPKIREIASFPGVEVDQAARMPNGRVILYQVHDSILAYDLSTKRSTLVTNGVGGEFTISRTGGRLAYTHPPEDGKVWTIWSIPIDPTNGSASGPAQRVSTGEGGAPVLSPDGRLIAFEVHRAPKQSDLALVPATGGTERVLSKFHAGIGGMSWSDDGKWVFVGTRADSPSVGHSIQRVPAAGGSSEPVFAVTTPARDVFTAGNGRVAYFYPGTAGGSSHGKMGYQAVSGEHGEFAVPGYAGIDFDLGSPKSLLVKSAREGSTIYELDMTPILQSLRKQ